jgi:hypothetical protein
VTPPQVVLDVFFRPRENLQNFRCNLSAGNFLKTFVYLEIISVIILEDTCSGYSNSGFPSMMQILFLEHDDKHVIK